MVPADTIWFMHGRTYHAATPNDSDITRRILIYSYGHLWKKADGGASADVADKITKQLVTEVERLKRAAH